MFNYRIVGMQKIGNKNIYTLQALNYTVNNKMVGTAELKELALKDQISNALWKSKLVEIPDRLEALVKLQGALDNVRCIRIEVDDISRDKQKRRTMLYDDNRRVNITYYVWCILSPFCSYSEEYGLILSDCNMKTSGDILHQVINIAKKNDISFNIRGYHTVFDNERIYHGKLD